MPHKTHHTTVAELREFLAQMRGKSPSEMLGAIASSNLFHSALVATAAISVAITALTLIPFAWGKVFHREDAATTAASAPGDGDTPPASTAPQPDLDAATDTTATPSAADRLGIGDSEDAPPNVNPLESSTGDLLEGLE